jgi:tetratricopeptide (TPR) repeat protein
LINSIRKSLVVTLVFLCSNCRTTSPRTSSDVLDGSDVESRDGTKNIPGMDDTLGLDTANMWSPGNRRANAIYHFLVAEKSLLAGDAFTAGEHFESSYNLDPNSFTGSQLVRSKILVNPKDSEALTEARRMALLYPQDADIRLLFGQSLMIARDFREAEVQLKKAIELNPRLESAYLFLIRGYQDQSKTDAAIDAAKKMVKANPQSPQSWSMLSRIFLSSKRVKESLEPARRAWELQENNPELALIYALSLDLNKRSGEAVKLYEQLYRFNPSNSELVERMVSLYKELGNLDDALTLLDDMIENAKDEVPGLRMQRVIILWEMNRNDDAFKEAQALVSSLPDSDRTMFLYAVALQRIGKIDEALEKFAKIQNESPLKSDALRLQALLLVERGKKREAIEILRQLCKRAEVQPLAFLILGEILVEDDQVKEAIEVANDGLKKFPKNDRILFAKGAFLERNGDRKEAESVMRELIAISPNHAAALNFLGYMLIEINENLDEAEELVKRALKIQPENGAYLDSLGWLYYQKKQYKRALEILEKAVANEPEEGVIWEHVGDVHLALGDKQKALDAFTKAVKCKNDRRDQDRIQKKYESLTKELKVGG